MSRAISIPGALVGGTLLGLLGALVAIPVTASILLIVKQVAIPRQDAKE
jgi:predicted PurR-regulated permease PerM